MAINFGVQSMLGKKILNKGIVLYIFVYIFIIIHFCTVITAKIKEAETIIEMNPPLEELDEQGENRPFEFYRMHSTLPLLLNNNIILLYPSKK